MSGEITRARVKAARYALEELRATPCAKCEHPYRSHYRSRWNPHPGYPSKPETGCNIPHCRCRGFVDVSTDTGDTE